jgi:thioesterase domain-containing protein
LNESCSGIPFFAYPGAGNKSTHFAELAHSLRDSNPFTVFLSGANDLTLENLTMEGRVKRGLEEVSRRSPSEVVILGYSLGGLMAVELARACMEEGYLVKLVILDTELPPKPRHSRSLNPKKHRAQSMFRSPPEPKLSARLQMALSAFTRNPKREIYRALVVTPAEWLLSIRGVRGSLRILLSMTFLGRFTVVKRALVDNFYRAEILDTQLVAITPEIAHSLSAYYVYTEGNSFLANWQSLIPNLNLVLSTGTHTSMLQEPHLQVIKEILLGNNSLQKQGNQ